MHQFQERDVDRKPDGKTLCKGDMGSVLLMLVSHCGEYMANGLYECSSP